MSPEAAKFDVGLWHADVGKEEPCTKDWLGKDVQDGISNDLLVDVHVARTISDTPDAVFKSVMIVLCLALMKAEGKLTLGRWSR